MQQVSSNEYEVLFRIGVIIMPVLLGVIGYFMKRQADKRDEIEKIYAAQMQAVTANFTDMRVQLETIRGELKLLNQNTHATAEIAARTAQLEVASNGYKHLISNLKTAIESIERRMP